jgi:hypothetical protein
MIWRTLAATIIGLLVGCGHANSSESRYATAINPIELCPANAAVRGQWYCDQTTVVALVSPSSDGNYTAYPTGTYNANLTGVSCTFTVSTIKVMDGSTTCYVTTQ